MKCNIIKKNIPLGGTSRGDFTMVKNINEQEFNNEVIEENGVVVVDFWATWCGPCKMIAPVIEELSSEISNVKFVKVDVDKNPSIASKFQIASIPTLKMFKNGEVVDTIVGFKPKAELEGTIKKYI